MHGGMTLETATTIKLPGNGWTGTTTASPSVIVLITTDGWRKTRLHRMAIP